MRSKRQTCASVEQYIASFPADRQALLNSVREVIRLAAPEAIESIAYGMPAYKLNGPLCYFALFEKHLGFYPTPRGIEKFQAELKPYKQGRGSVQFPLDKQLPLDLIRRMVLQRVISASQSEPEKSSGI